MESRRLVVWISTGILGFQGVTLGFDLLNCTALNCTAPAPGPTPNPLNLFCERPQGRIDGAVSQGLSILAGLALGGSVGSRGAGEP